MTRRIKVGLMVTGNIYHNPGILIKKVTTLDVLSGGRAYFGIGAGWYEREAKGLGIPFPASWSERFERLEETLKIAKHMWAGNTAPYIGKYYTLAEPVNNPQPLSKPHPPIMIGGSGEKKALKLVAKYGDACNFYFGGSFKGAPSSIIELYEQRREFLQRKLTVLKEHCKAVDRSYDEIERTAQGTVNLASGANTPSELVELCRELADLGFQHVVFHMPNTDEIKPIEIIGQEVIPAVADFKASD